MKIHHIGIWANDLEALKDFYVAHFNAKSTAKYINPNKHFSSYFLTFDDGAKLELMHSQTCSHSNTSMHIAFSTGSAAQVDRFYDYARRKGIKIIAPPRTTGDGFYELLITDPENNQIEVTI